MLQGLVWAWAEVLDKCWTVKLHLLEELSHNKYIGYLWCLTRPYLYICKLQEASEDERHDLRHIPSSRALTAGSMGWPAQSSPFPPKKEARRRLGWDLLVILGPDNYPRLTSKTDLDWREVQKKVKPALSLAQRYLLYMGSAATPGEKRRESGAPLEHPRQRSGWGGWPENHVKVFEKQKEKQKGGALEAGGEQEGISL